MRGVTEAIGRRLARLEGRLMDLSGLLLVALLVLINVEVAARYLFNSSTLIADEYAGYLFVWMVMLGGVNLLRADRYLTVTTVVDKFSPRVQNLIGIAAALIGLFVSGVAVYATWAVVASSWRFGTVSIQPSSTKLAWPQIVMPFGYGLLCLAYFEEILRRFLGLEPRRDDKAAGGLG